MLTWAPQMCELAGWGSNVAAPPPHGPSPNTGAEGCLAHRRDGHVSCWSRSERPDTRLSYELDCEMQVEGSSSGCWTGQGGQRRARARREEERREGGGRSAGTNPSSDTKGGDGGVTGPSNPVSALLRSLCPVAPRQSSWGSGLMKSLALQRRQVPEALIPFSSLDQQGVRQRAPCLLEVSESWKAWEALKMG